MVGVVTATDSECERGEACPYPERDRELYKDRLQQAIFFRDRAICILHGTRDIKLCLERGLKLTTNPVK